MDSLSSLQFHSTKLSQLHAQSHEFIRHYTNDPLIFVTNGLLTQAREAGDTCLNLVNFSGQSIFWDNEEIICPNLAKWEQYLYNLPDLFGSAQNQRPFILENGQLSWLRDWQDEHDCARALQQRCKPWEKPDKSLLSLIQKLFPHNSEAIIDGVDWARFVTLHAAGSSLTLLCGGPGTGKTSAAYRMLLFSTLSQKTEHTPHIICAAPTGKACARLQEALLENKEHFREQGLFAAHPRLEQADAAIPLQCLTIHRLLYQQHIYVDILLIDEVSMIDSALMAALLRKVPKHCRIIGIGDPQQLRSVQPGAVLDACVHNQEASYSEIICQTAEAFGDQVPTQLQQKHHASKNILAAHIIRLRKNWRAAHAPLIQALADSVINGRTDDCLTTLTKNKLQYSLETIHNAAKILWTQQIEKVWEEKDNVLKALDSMSDVAILCAYRQGRFGSEQLAREIDQYLHHHTTHCNNSLPIVNNQDFQQRHYHGQLLLITENDQHSGLVNGDLVIMWKHNKSDNDGENNEGTEQFMACFRGSDNKLHSIPSSYLPQHQPAYAITVHKSQGSQYRDVHIVLGEVEIEQQALLNRELFYTAITRSKHNCQVYGTLAAIKIACSQQTQRHGRLRELLEQD